MPRARINADGEEIVLPKTRTRKPRVVPAEGEVKVVRKRAAPRPRVVSPDPEPASPALSRKAPTPLAAKRKSRSQKSKTLIAVLGVCFLIGVAGVGIGFMDGGSIDVVAVVNERNEKINKGEVRDDSGQVVTQTIQVQNEDARPNGGLKIGDAPVTSTPAISTPNEATSSAETATTTETVPSLEATTTSASTT